MSSFKWTICGALIAAFIFVGPASASAADCQDIDVTPDADNIEVIRTAILCLANAERSERDLAGLDEHTRLRKAARGHSSDMVREGYFAHTEPDGDTLVDRVIDSGYTRRSDGWALGENLAWGTGDRGTARGVHDAWMRSRSHRAVILNGTYRDLGIGVRLGIPKDPDVGATFTINFGVKR